MRNRFAGLCYICGFNVKPGDGHFERHAHMLPSGKVSAFRLRHVSCKNEPKKFPPKGD